MKERIKELRKTLNLNQKEFGDKIGVTTSTISGYESGRRTPNESVIKSICREFNVNPFWLKEGKGEPINNIPETILDELVDEYNLDELQKNIVKTYLELDEQDKNVITNFLLKALKK